MTGFGDKTFRQMKSGKVDYRGKGYDAWMIEVPGCGELLFADTALLAAIEVAEDEGCPVDDMVAYYADQDQRVEDAIGEYLA